MRSARRFARRCSTRSCRPDETIESVTLSGAGPAFCSGGATPDAFVTLPEVRMGLVPGVGGSVSVVRLIGRWRAAWLMLSGERLPAAAALRWGLVDEIARGR
jgi:enoyl-CoA hydratase/carnithine racemase